MEIKLFSKVVLTQIKCITMNASRASRALVAARAASLSFSVAISTVANQASSALTRDSLISAHNQLYKNEKETADGERQKFNTQKLSRGHPDLFLKRRELTSATRFVPAGSALAAICRNASRNHLVLPFQ